VKESLVAFNRTHANRVLAALRLEEMYNEAKISMVERGFPATMTKAEAQTLVDAGVIKKALHMDQEDVLLLTENNPTLLKAYVTLELIAKYGKW
jgi:hypothetical protein